MHSPCGSGSLSRLDSSEPEQTLKDKVHIKINHWLCKNFGNHYYEKGLNPNLTELAKDIVQLMDKKKGA